jgi:hypothetical protein
MEYRSRLCSVKRSISFLVPLVFLALVAWVLWLTTSTIRDARIKHRLMSVKIGMSRAEVLAVAGKPQFTKAVAIGFNTNGEIWVYPHKPAESEPPRCVFGGANGTVVGVVVDENYRIGRLD